MSRSHLHRSRALAITLLALLMTSPLPAFTEAIAPVQIADTFYRGTSGNIVSVDLQNADLRQAVRLLVTSDPSKLDVVGDRVAPYMGAPDATYQKVV